MRRILISLAVLSALAAPGFADDTRVMGSITMPEIRSLIEAEGFSIVKTGEDGPNSIRAVAEGGLIFNVIGTAYDTTLTNGCLGLNMQVRYDADGEETLERINNANLMWPATAIWYTEVGFNDGGPTVGVSRYVILDHGVTAANIKENLINLLAIAPQAADYIWQAGRYAPDYEGDDDDWYYDDW